MDAPPRMRRMLLGVLLVFGAGTQSPANMPGDEPAPVRTDPFGDRLPEGALARLGTLRLVHLGHIKAVAVSPDGKFAASGVSGGKTTYLGWRPHQQFGGFGSGWGVREPRATIRLWDTATGKLIREITTPDAPVSSLHFSPIGGTLFAGCGDNLCAWDTATGRKFWEQDVPKGVRFEQGGQTETLLLARDKLISVHGGRLYCPVPIDGGTSHQYYAQLAVRFWDGKTGKPLPLPPVLESTIHAENRITTLFHEVALSPDGAYAAVLVSQADPQPTDGNSHEDKWLYSDCRIHIIDLSTGKVLHSIPDDKGAFANLAFADDGRTLALAAGKEIWLVRTATGVKERLTDLRSSLSQLVFIDEDRQLAAHLGNDSIRVWDVRTRKPIDPHTVHVHHFETAKGGHVVATSHGNTLRLIDRDSGKTLHAFVRHRWAPLVRFAVHAPDTLISSDHECAYLWDIRSWKIRDRLVIPAAHSQYRRVFYQMRDARMDQGVSVETGLYVKDTAKRIELRDLRTDRLIRSLEQGPEQGWWSHFSASGNRLIIREDKLFQFFDVETGKCLSRLRTSDVVRLGFSSPELLSPDGTFFATNRSYDRIDLFDNNLGRAVRGLVRHFGGENGNEGSILGFQFSADGQTVLGEVHEQVRDKNLNPKEKVGIMLWDVQDGKAIQEFECWPADSVFRRDTLNAPLIQTLAVSNDRRLVAFAPKGGKTVEIWETASGTKRGELAGHVGPVVDLAFSADGRRLASGSEDTTVLVWDLNRPLRPGRFRNRLDEKELAAHLQTLLQPDAQKADAAIWGLAYAPADRVLFLKKHLRPVAGPDVLHVRRLLGALDRDDYKARSGAEAELERHGELVLGELEAALQAKNTLEKQRRLEGLVRKARKAARPFGTAQRVGQWRALEVLERITTPEARQLLRDLAKGSPGAQLTAAARACLARLETLAQLKH